ncbi:peptidoglycan recognition protein family protein [Roseitalea porphyridii]|uniref:peptidoglycan recognition protein family protein n=1 Tax=Roseitalea porphyridii TaxID=1852022 RepID=UPI001FCE448F|nr:N-acetylmuramoyl-L-alanine amidase [Roseitalea porphyridii]
MSGPEPLAPFDAEIDGATVRPSPNFGERRTDDAPHLIVLHYTGMATGPAAEDWLCAPESEVSSHYLVHEDGGIVQMVPEEKRAWHAGRSFWRGIADVNSASVGIEIANGGHAFGLPDYPEPQIAAVVTLVAAIMARHGIGAHDVIAHSDVAPGRKQDPGERFPWGRLAEAGAAIHAAPVPVGGGRFFAPGDVGEPVAALQSMLGLYGFDTDPDGVFGEKTRIQIEAFQRRHRPARVDGIADMSTIETLNRVLRLYPSLG